MSQRDLASNLGFAQLLDPATRTGTDTTVTTDRTLDTQGFESAVLVVSVGESGLSLSAGETVDVSIQHADDSGDGTPGTFSDVTDNDLVVIPQKNGSITAPYQELDSNGVFLSLDDDAEDDGVYYIGYIGGKRHLDVEIDLVGAHTSGIPLSVIGIAGHPHFAPVETDFLGTD